MFAGFGLVFFFVNHKSAQFGFLAVFSVAVIFSYKAATEYRRLISLNVSVWADVYTQNLFLPKEDITRSD